MATEKTRACSSRKQARKIMCVAGPTVAVHHKDGNPLNNSIENLIIMGRGEHQRYHLCKRWGSPFTVGTSVEVLEKLLSRFNRGIF